MSGIYPPLSLIVFLLSLALIFLSAAFLIEPEPKQPDSPASNSPVWYLVTKLLRENPTFHSTRRQPINKLFNYTFMNRHLAVRGYINRP